MALKCTSSILVGFLFITLSCSKNKLNDTIDSSRDSVGIYLDKALNPKTPFEKRLLYNKKTLSLLLKQKNDSLNSDKLIKVANNFYRLNSWKSLKTTSQKALARSIEKKDDYFIGQSYRFLGLYYINISINDSAFYFFSKAERVYKKSSNYEELCRINLDKGLVQYFICDFLGSETSAIKALKIAKKHKLIPLEVDCYSYLIMNSFDLQNYKSCIEYSKKSLELIQKNNSLFEPQDISFSLKEIGYSYFGWGKMNEAIEYFKLALNEDLCPIKYPTSYCFLLDDYANAKLKKGDYKNIENIHKRAAEIRDSLHIDLGRNLNKRFLSEYYQATNQIPKAQKFAHEAYTLSKSYRNAGDILLSLKQLAKVDTQNALKYSQEYIRISDSMQQLERVTRNKFAKIAYETEEITTEKDEAIQQKQIFFGIAVLIFIIAALVVLLLMQRAKQKELQFLQEQQKTNEEIYQLIQNQQSQIDEARHIEKKRIAQDLHDGIMNRLSSTRLNLHILNEKATPEIIKKCLPFIAGIQDIEKEIRNVSHDLNKEVFATNDGFLAILNALFDQQKSGCSIQSHFEIDNTINWERLESIKKVHLYRILQEALQNTQKHAQAQNIIVSLRNQNHAVVLEIYDDGVGFRPKDTKQGIGLQNIYARVKACQGTITIQSTRSTTIRIVIPFQKKV